MDGTKTQTRRLLGNSGPRTYRIGQEIAIQPGRGQKSIGRIRITEIRLERLQDITEADARAEIGVYPTDSELLLIAFRVLWDTIHRKRGERWQDSPLVWVLNFELVTTEIGKEVGDG